MTTPPDDLCLLARRGSLSAAEQRRFEMYLKTSEEGRILHDVGRDFDAMRTARPGDEALLARVADRVRSRFAGDFGRPLRRSIWRSVGLMALGALISSGAAAGVWQLGGIRNAADPGTAQGQPAKGPDESGPGRRRENASPIGSSAAAPSLGPDAETKAVPSPTSEPEVQRAPDHPVPAAAPSAGVDLDGARALFSRANAERKAGSTADALSSYAQLQKAFPASAEAQLSHVLTARLLLRHGDASGALGHFDRYLRGPQSSLAEEALQGKAEALRVLGRHEEERTAWRELLARFPKSIHATTARERLSRSH